ncbi:ABC transporter permease [Rosistilla carotiformis]|uniref:ABC transporter permease n=1 Tax=Rosistilla carotiformis TaxID=2528017 RepID=UPI0018D1FA13|nr:ABC transporter permease [Rosistilla carotiformis]
MSIHSDGLATLVTLRASGEICLVPASRYLTPPNQWQLGRRFARTTELIGKRFIETLKVVISLLALIWAVFFIAASPRSWTPFTRLVFARQLLFTAVDGLLVAMRISAAVGVLVIVQTAMWLDAVGATTEGITPVLWKAVIHEIAPLIASLVVIGRSGIAISTELATMLVSGELEVLESQGIDPMTTLIMPRVLSVTLSVFCLAIVVATTMLVTGYMIGWLVGVIHIPWANFLEKLLYEVNVLDFVFFVPKTIVAGAFAGAICCADGLTVRGTMADIPRIASRSGIHAMTAVFGVSAIMSILIYGRILVFKIL